MTIITIQEIGKTSTGKPKVKAGGQWYFLGRNIDAPAQGATVEIREGSFKFGDGTPAKTIEAWRPASSGSAQQQPAPPPGYVDEASMRFISNCVGSAITAGTIKEPGQIASWFRAAKAALEGKDAPIPFDDNMADDGWAREQ